MSNKKCRVAAPAGQTSSGKPVTKTGALEGTDAVGPKRGNKKKLRRK